MCTLTLEIDENAIKAVRPDLDSKEAIRRWAQDVLDANVKELAEVDDTMDVEEFRQMLHATISNEYARV